LTTLCEELQAGRPSGRTAVTLGVFDGVHLGHRHLLTKLNEAAARRELTSIVVTLANHPLTVLRPDVQVVLLTSLNERLDLLAGSGVGRVLPVTFTREISQLTAEEFMQALVDCLGLEHFVVGPDFALGRGRLGTIPVLTEVGSRLGFTVETVAPFDLDGAAVRSTAVREAVAAGNVEQAAVLLGRPFALDGPIVEGEQRGGGLLGFPTANLGVGPLQALPADGIYATWMAVDGARYPAATSVGIKPTFHETGPRVVESFVLDFDGNLYGKHARLEFVRHLRGQERFDTVDALIAQMHRDVAATRAALAGSSIV
jgi:riboflavin kinase / FMN adenylyltransferase